MKYWAFISYNHSDKKWAEWLHNAIESYRIPKELVRKQLQSGESTPERLYPVFRDSTGLPAGSKLSSAIMNALVQSYSLIVICSPQTPKSHWVDQEILEFKKLGRGDYIFALIVDGEPNASDEKPGIPPSRECFPDALKYSLGVDKELDKTCWDEPLAADAREDRDGKQNAKLKILAGVLGVDYDDLKKRDEERARRFNRMAFTAGAVLLILFGTLAGMALWQSHVAAEQKAAAQMAQAEEVKLRLQAQARAYASDMNLARQALREDKFGRAVELLIRQCPAPGQKDLRGWEWRYLWKLTHDQNSVTICQQTNPVATLAVSANSQLLAVGFGEGGGGSGALELWDLNAHRQLARTVEEGSYCSRVAFSPTEPLLVFATDKGSLSDRQTTLHLWDVATRGTPDTWKIEGLCLGLAFSSDGHELLTSTSSGERIGLMTLWRIPEKTVRARYRVVQPPLSYQASAFAATSDLRLTAYGSSDGRINVIDVRNTNELWSSNPSDLRITALAFSPDQHLLASASGYLQNDISLLDASTGEVKGRLEGHSAFVTSLMFWPDGKLLASGSADQTIRVWDVVKHNCLAVLRGHHDVVYRLAFSPGQSNLISGSNDGAVCVWNSSAMRMRATSLVLPDFVAAFCFAPDSKSLLTLNNNGQVTRWSGSEFEQKDELFSIGRMPARGAFLRWLEVFSSDAQSLAVGSTNGIISIWNVRNHTLSCELTNTSDDFAPLEFARRGESLITGGDDILKEWDIKTGSKLQSWSASWKPGASLSPDGTVVAAFSADAHHLVIRDLVGKRTQQVELMDMIPSRSTFSPDGSLFVLSGFLGYVQVWDAIRWHELMTLRGFLLGTYAISFSPDGKRLATGGMSERAIRLWETEEWQELFMLDGEGGSYGSVAFSRDGNDIGALDANGKLQIWQAPSWKEIRTIGEDVQR